MEADAAGLQSGHGAVSAGLQAGCRLTAGLLLGHGLAVSLLLLLGWAVGQPRAAAAAVGRLTKNQAASVHRRASFTQSLNALVFGFS